jgi:hypothetical protein
MSIKDHALLVSLTVNKPQMTQKDIKATSDAELANNAHGAGQYRKDLYPKSLIQPINMVESQARAYINSTTYPWNRGDDMLPSVRFMQFADRMAKYELEFDQSVTAFLNNWSNVMMHAQASQGGLFDPSAYPDLQDLRKAFRFRINYRPITDIGDFRVSMQEDELDTLRQQVEEATKESMNAIMRAPLERLKEVVARLHEVTGKGEREIINKKTGISEIRSPIFRDSVCENIAEEINLLHDFAEILPDNILSLAKTVIDTTPHPQQLRDDPQKRMEVNIQTTALLASIEEMLEF